MHHKAEQSMTDESQTAESIAAFRHEILERRPRQSDYRGRGGCVKDTV
jgi:hypothetical protein